MPGKYSSDYHKKKHGDTKDYSNKHVFSVSITELEKSIELLASNHWYKINELDMRKNL